MDTALAVVKSSDGQSFMGRPIRASLAQQSISRAGYYSGFDSGGYGGYNTSRTRHRDVRYGYNSAYDYGNYDCYGSSGRFSDASNGYHAPPWQSVTRPHPAPDRP
jgi:hypothetical protein